MSVAALLRKVDAVQLPVPDLDAALAFYRDRLGHALVWRTATAAGLRVPESQAELVLQTERPDPEVDWLVDSVETAALQWVAAGGQLLVAPFDIQIGRCAVVADPFGNTLVLLDASQGSLLTDRHGRVVGNAPSEPGTPPTPAP